MWAAFRMASPRNGRRARIAARSARWLLVCAAPCALAATPCRASSSADVPTDVSVQGPMTARLTKPFDAPLEMSWRARVDAANLEFRVYAGPDAEHLRLRATVPARPGERDYRFRDTASGAHDVLYEVRAAADGGHEQILARAFCTRTSDLRGGVTPRATDQLDGTLVIWSWAETPGNSHLRLGDAAFASRPRAQPLVPPPRSSQV
jgi:hypothetical protein